MNWGASYLVNDLYKRFVQPDADDRQLLLMSRLASFVVLVLGGFVDQAREHRRVRVGQHQQHVLELRALALVHGHREGRFHIRQPAHGHTAQRVAFQEAGAQAVAAALSAKAAQLDLLSTLPKSIKFDAATVAAHLAYGAKLRAYRFDKYKTKEKAEDKPKLKTVSVRTGVVEKAKKLYAPLEAIAESVAFTRDIVSEPANVIYPESLAAECRKLAKLGLKVEVLGEAQMKKLGMGSLLGVGQGSVRESQLVIMQWHGGKKGQKPVALVGKGVTFDTGGISIKPSNGMEEMKWDMGGSAAVIGTMRALAASGAKANVIGVVGLVENMPDALADGDPLLLAHHRLQARDRLAHLAELVGLDALAGGALHAQRELLAAQLQQLVFLFRGRLGPVRPARPDLRDSGR